MHEILCDRCEQWHAPEPPCGQPVNEIRDDDENVTGYAWTWLP